eukprot:3979009-Amphidinium_carterae.1
MATGDSAVLFESKVREYGRGDPQAKFMELGQGRKEEIFKDEIVLPVVGDAATPAQISGLRCLLTECYTLALDELKRKTEHGDPQAAQDPASGSSLASKSSKSRCR